MKRNGGWSEISRSRNGNWCRGARLTSEREIVKFSRNLAIKFAGKFYLSVFVSHPWQL